MNDNNFATVDDVESLWRPMANEEIIRANALLPVVTNILRNEAKKVGKDLDVMTSQIFGFKDILKSVTVDVVARAIMTSTDQEPMTQISESAGGYSASGTFLVPGGGLFIKRSELARLGLRRQRYGGMDIYGLDKGNSSNSL